MIPRIPSFLFALRCFSKPRTRRARVSPCSLFAVCQTRVVYMGMCHGVPSRYLAHDA